MNTAIAITAIIAALLLASTIVTAVRDVAKIKHQPAKPEATLARVRAAALTRLADDECGEQERRGYHSAMAEILAILNDQEQQ